MQDVKELLKKIPKNYRELNWKIYLEMINNVMIDRPESMDDEDFKSYQAYSMISILLNMPISELEKLPYTTIIPLINSLAFLNQEIQITTTRIKLKDIETLTFKEFQSLIQLVSNQWINMQDILETVILDKSVEEINQLSIWEVVQIMGKLKKLYRKSLQRSQISLGLKIVKMVTMGWIKKIFKIKG